MDLDSRCVVDLFESSETIKHMKTLQKSISVARIQWLPGLLRSAGMDAAQLVEILAATDGNSAVHLILQTLLGLKSTLFWTTQEWRSRLASTPLGFGLPFLVLEGILEVPDLEWNSLASQLRLKLRPSLSPAVVHFACPSLTYAPSRGMTERRCYRVGWKFMESSHKTSKNKGETSIWFVCGVKGPFDIYGVDVLDFFATRTWRACACGGAGVCYGSLTRCKALVSLPVQRSRWGGSTEVLWLGMEHLRPRMKERSAWCHFWAAQLALQISEHWVEALVESMKLLMPGDLRNGGAGPEKPAEGFPGGCKWCDQTNYFEQTWLVHGRCNCP